MDIRQLTPTEIAQFLRTIDVQPAAASLDFLNQLIRQTVAHIPFQNLTLINAKRRPNDAQIIQDMTRGIGGLCNTRNAFFYALLGSFNFNVRFLSATMHQPDCHIVLLVTLNNRRYLVDIGNGFPYLQAMDIAQNRTYTHPYLQHKLVSKNGRFYLRHQAKSAGKWVTNYQFDLTPSRLSDFDLMLDKHYSEQGWGPFLTGLRFNQWTATGGVIIRDKLLLKLNGSSTEKRRLAQFSDFEKALTTEFSPANFAKIIDIKRAWTALNL